MVKWLIVGLALLSVHMVLPVWIPSMQHEMVRVWGYPLRWIHLVSALVLYFGYKLRSSK